ncbi:MAG: nucleoside deaminase [Rikenellaceae bacterium]
MKVIDSEHFMKQALREAQRASKEDEVPVGAVIECGGRVLAVAHNLTQRLCDPTAHAEMQAITAACNALGAKYLSDCTLYVTLEPCPMCAAALRWAQIGTVVWGADDPKSGFRAVSTDMLHPKTVVHSGVLAEECSALMVDFFGRKRTPSKR